MLGPYKWSPQEVGHRVLRRFDSPHSRRQVRSMQLPMLVLTDPSILYIPQTNEDHSGSFELLHLHDAIALTDVSGTMGIYRLLVHETPVSDV